MIFVTKKIFFFYVYEVTTTDCDVNSKEDPKVTIRVSNKTTNNDGNNNLATKEDVHLTLVEKTRALRTRMTTLKILSVQ